MKGPTHAKVVRLARNRRNGRRYIVQQIDFRTNMVHTWGEVVLFDTRKGTVKHDGSLSFDLRDTDVFESPLTRELLDELFEQTRASYEYEIASGELKVEGRTSRTRSRPVIA